ncbi:MAG: MBL fold metallo-hydrolase [Bacilli bacterium]|nr:MBL fold metallo-hydrolase [Bacilli bacterium]
MIKVFRFDNDRYEFSANTYVVGIKNGPCVVIDLGTTQDRVIKYIKENHTSCSGILLTHGHFDHIRGINKFLEEYNCTIFIDEKDNELLENPRLNGLEEEQVIVKSQNRYLLDDQDEINFGNGLFFKVIETPFHTQGSVCFLYEKENALFTGDTLFKGSIGRTDLPGGKQKQVEGSLNILKNLDPKLIVYPGHGEQTTLEHEIKTNYFMNGGR